MNQSSIYLLIALGVILLLVLNIVFFIVTRKAMLWYWRIDDIVKHLENISSQLQNLNPTEKKPVDEFVNLEGGIKSPNSIR